MGYGITDHGLTFERFEHPSPLDNVAGNLREVRGQVDRMKLQGKLRRIQPHVFGSERAELAEAQLVLERGGFDARAIARMDEAAEKKLGSLPPEKRSLQFPVQIRSTGGSRVVTFVASTDGLDRHGTKILPMGIDTTKYETNPIAIFGHDGYGGMFNTPQAENILGKTVRLRKSEKRLEADIEFLPASVNPKAEMVLGMVRAGAVSAVSIGFIPREVHMEIDPQGNEIPVITKSELLEISIVPIPSNPDALATGRGKTAA